MTTYKREYKNDSICRVNGCNKDQYVKGYCKAHYLRFHRYGDPLGGTRFHYGEGWINDSGYRMRDHKRDHRIIMEKFLGRKLKKSEIIHHKNHNRLDNRIENLEITTQKIHGKMYSGRRKYFFCTIPGCGKVHRGRGLCMNHYMQFRRGRLSIALASGDWVFGGKQKKGGEYYER